MNYLFFWDFICRFFHFPFEDNKRLNFIFALNFFSQQEVGAPWCCALKGNIYFWIFALHWSRVILLSGGCDLRGGSLLVDLHQAAQVIDVHQGAPGGHGLRLDPPVLGLVQVGHDAAQLLALFSLPVALHQISAHMNIADTHTHGY